VGPNVVQAEGSDCGLIARDYSRKIGIAPQFQDQMGDGKCMALRAFLGTDPLCLAANFLFAHHTAKMTNTHRTHPELHGCDTFSTVTRGRDFSVLRF
jgi:hypothetical protein